MSRLIFNMAAKCDKAGRSENQDNYWVCPNLTHWDAPIGKTVGNDEDVELSEKGALLVVADGMGGMNAGEKASELVIESVKKRFSNIPDSILSNEEKVKRFIKETITEADLSVKDYAKYNRSAEGLGSTIVMLWILNNRAYCGWCGDSRIYRYNPNNELIRLSHDHSYVQGLVDDGKISEEEAFDHPDSNIITRSLGDNGDVANPEIMVYDVCDRDVFLLCSDGLCGLLQDKEIEDIISRNCSSTKDALASLWDAGSKTGWSDNATIDLLTVISGGKRPKGVAVGYPTNKQAILTNKTPHTKKSPNNIATSTEGSAVKFFRPPYLYFIMAVAIAILCFALYKTHSANSDGKQENFNFTVGTGDSTSSQTVGNLDQTSVPISDNSEGSGNVAETSQQNAYNSHNKPNANCGYNNGHNGVNQQNSSNNGRNNRNNGNIQQNPNVNNGVNVGNNGGNTADDNTNTIISSINGQQGNSHGQEPTQVQTQPDSKYIKLLNEVREDVPNVNKLWQNVCRHRNVTNSEYKQFKDFITNVNNLANKNNPSYNCLDENTKKEINSWLRLKKEIQNNLNNFQRINDEQEYGGYQM